jgi:penicillin-binding protein 2
MVLNERNKFLIFSGFLMFAFLVLMTRFAYVQLIEGEAYQEESDRNRVRENTIYPPRGLIYDRAGTLLVNNQPAYSIYVVPAELKKNPEALKSLATTLELTPVEILARIKRNSISPVQPVKIERMISFETLSFIKEHSLDLPGVIPGVESRREYPTLIRAPHLFGYLGEITESELAASKSSGYRQGDLVGKKGIEKRYEEFLQGEKGFRYVQVDALGREAGEIAELPTKQPVPGKNLYLSLDASLQQAIETAMTGKRGGAAVLNCKNGEVLALVSEPNYDPELFAKPISTAAWNELVNDPAHPMYDRMVQSLYAPGSTFKLVLALAGLQTGLIDPRERVFCPGYFKFGRRTFKCHRKGGHGSVDLSRAIEASCDVYFYRMGLKVGLENWSAFARKFGFGQRSQIDLIGESAGLVPDTEYFDQRYGKNGWTKGQLVNLSIGQGDLLVTPLQMACLAMAIANNGSSFRPRLRYLIEDPIGREKFRQAPDSVKIEGIELRHYERVKEAMVLAVNGKFGTAHSAIVRGVTTAGKTGTAQNPHGDDHAWFIGFAPYEDPQVAWCVFVENGGHGSSAAAPVARLIVSLLRSEGKLIVPSLADAGAKNVQSN